MVAGMHATIIRMAAFSKIEGHGSNGRSWPRKHPFRSPHTHPDRNRRHSTNRFTPTPVPSIRDAGCHVRHNRFRGHVCLCRRRRSGHPLSEREESALARSYLRRSSACTFRVVGTVSSPSLTGSLPHPNAHGDRRDEANRSRVTSTRRMACDTDLVSFGVSEIRSVVVLMVLGPQSRWSF
jgi:hypothetical protein